MSTAVVLAALSTIVAAIPALAFRRRLLLNPAFYVLLIVGGSVLLKTLYVVLLRSEPLPTRHDGIYVDAASPDFLVPGGWLALAAIVAYTGGFLAIGARTIAAGGLARLRDVGLPRSAPRNLLVLSVLTIAAFVLYLIMSDTAFFELPFSAKRFAPRQIDAPSRFHYAPYYLFKIALTSGAIACAAALALFRTGDRVYRGPFALAFLFALTLSHFASLRMFILLVLLQVVLLLVHFRAHRELRFVSLFVLLTGASFFVITVVNRAPPEAAAEMVQAGVRDSGVPAGIVPRVAARLASAGFEGRYFMDVTKLAHIARHFPSQAPFLLGGGLIGLPPPLAPRDESGQGGSINQYLAQQVFDEATNNVPPGFAGELYINFAGPGLFLGFLALGAAHRLLRNHLLDASTPGLVTACLVLLIPSTTLVLFNSGMLPAASRSVIDTAVVLVIWRPRVAR